MQKNFFRGKRILITGITGFVGSHLARRLQSLGAVVYGFSRRLDSENVAKINILHLPKVQKFINTKKIEICFHLAAQSLVESGQKDPYKTFSINIQGTLNILESARKNNLERVIIASSSHVYGNNRLPYYERYTPRPSRPYETSKACTDLIAQSYADTFNLPVFIPRFVNIYGPGDFNFNRVIPQVIKSIHDDLPPRMWGGDAVRDYLFIEDAIDAYIRLAIMDIPYVGNDKIFNFGSGNLITVRDLIQKIILLSGKRALIKKASDKRPFEIKSQYVSFAKAKRVLHWQPRFSLDEGLKKSIEWYKKYFRENSNTL